MGSANPGVVVGGVIVKAAGEELGYVVAMTDRTVTIFDPVRNAIFAINDSTGFLVGRYRYEEPENEVRLYEDLDCSGRSAGQYSDLFNGQFTMGSAADLCDSRSYAGERRLNIFAEDGDSMGLSQGSRAVFISGVEFAIRAIGTGPDVCNEYSFGFCVLGHAVARGFPLQFATPITIEEPGNH